MECVSTEASSSTQHVLIEEPVLAEQLDVLAAEPLPTKPKILLFGRTGSGKSTVANMLIKGNLSPPLVFPTSSGVRGRTRTFQREESDNWVVVDTIGLGEGKYGTVLDAEARNHLYDFFVKISHESYNYYAYVQKWGKLDELDERLWNFFKQAFDGAERNFVVIFTHCSSKVLEDNLEDVKGFFQECERYIAVDFPAIYDAAGTPASARTRRNEVVRETSSKRLQESLQSFIEPPITLCLRSNLKNGRILVMGTATRARNMVAKLLVDGSSVSMAGVDGMALNGNEEDGSPVFEELEGRRWQVVNALAFDSAFLSRIYDGALVQDKAVTAATKLLASNFLTILEHGQYSHLVYVAESGEMPPASIILLREILKARKWKSFKTLAVIVSYNAGAQPKMSCNELKELTTICEIHLPSCCDPTGTEDGISHQQCALVALEDTIFQCSSYLFWRPVKVYQIYDRHMHFLSSDWDNQDDLYSEKYLKLWGLDQMFHPEKLEVINNFVNPVAFKGLLYAHLEEWQGVKAPSGLSKIDFGLGEVDLLESGSCYRTVLRMPFKHIVGESSYLENKRNGSITYLQIISSGRKISLRKGLENAFIWGELQVVDKHHVDKKLPRLPLSIGGCLKSTGSNIDTWILGLQSVMEREFIESLSTGDTVILWMYPHPYPLVPHETRFEIHLLWSECVMLH